MGRSRAFYAKIKHDQKYDKNHHIKIAYLASNTAILLILLDNLKFL